MAQTSIFVSHSHQDNDWCRSFVEALKSVGYDVWYDEQGLRGGAQWIATIQAEVQARDVFVVVLTPEAWASQWVQDELQLAIATRRRVLPVLLRNCQVDGFLLTTQWVTVIGEEPEVAARSVIIAVEAPPAPGKGAAPVATTEALDDLITLCRSLASEKRYTEALSACGRALVLDPNNTDVLRVKGNVLLRIGEPYKAAEEWGRELSYLSGAHLYERPGEIYGEFYRYLVGDTKTPGYLPRSSDVEGLAAHLPGQYGVEGVNSKVEGYYLAMTRQLSSGDALCAVFEDLTTRHFILARLAPAIANDELVLALFATAKARNHLKDIVRQVADGRYGYLGEKAGTSDIQGLRYYQEALFDVGDMASSRAVEFRIGQLFDQA